MIETGLVYIYSVPPAREFIGCGALVEGGYIATCRHVWRDAIDPENEATGEPCEVEIEFPRARDKQGVPIVSRAAIADDCQGLEVPAPDLVMLKPLNIPTRAGTVPFARHPSSEVGAAYALAGLIGLDESKPDFVRDVPIEGVIANYKDAAEGMRKFTGDNLPSYFSDRGASGSPVFLKDGHNRLAGILVLSVQGANEGKTHLRQAFVLPATTVIRYLGRHLAKPIAEELKVVALAKMQPFIDGLCAQDHVPTSEFAACLREYIVALRTQAEKPVPASNDGADIDATIVASREKLGALDFAGALDVLKPKIAEVAEEVQAHVRRFVPLLKERAAVERLALDYDAAKSTLTEVTRLAPDDLWAYIDLGDLYRIIGPLAEALKAFRNAETAARRLGDERDLLVVINKTGDTQRVLGDLVGALKSYNDGLIIRSRLAESGPDNARWQRDLSDSFIKIGEVQSELGDLAGALTSYRHCVDIFDRLAKSDPKHPLWQRDLAVSYDNVGDVQNSQGDLAGALKSYYDSFAIRDRLAKSSGGDAFWQRELSLSFDKFGDVQTVQGDRAGALKSFNDSLAIKERLVRSDPFSPELRRDLFHSYSKIYIADKLAQFGPGNAEWQRDLSVAYKLVGDLQKAQGDLAGALKLYEADLAIAERLAKSEPGNALWQRDLSESFGKLASVHRQSGDNAKALDFLRQGQAIMARLTKLSPDNAEWKQDFAWFDGQIQELTP
jgi:tetratricopeptide (TPR) repeat protein